MANKFKKVLALSAAVLALGLTSCDKVEAELPKDEKILNFTGNEEITNNQLTKIYDALVSSGDSNSKRVLENVLFLYAEGLFGSFYDVKEGTTVKEYGIKSAVEGGKDGAAFTAYIEKHKGMRVEANDALDKAASFAKVKGVYTDILYRVYKSFYGYIKDATYQDRSRFCEEKFYQAQVKNYYDLGNAYYTTDDNNYYVLVDGAFRLDEAYAADDQLSAYYKDLFGTYENFIKLNLLPDIYRNELTAQYLVTQNIYQIRNTMARKVDFISVAENGDYNGKVKDLMNAYCEKVIKTGLQDQFGFTWLNKVVIGADKTVTTSAKAVELYAAAGWSQDTVTVGTETYNFYKESTFGTNCLKYKKLLSVTTRDDSDIDSIRVDFTNSGAYTKETGFLIKYNTLIAQNDTDTGWYTNGSLSGVPSSLSSRLFKIQVANELDDKNANEKYLRKVQDDGATTVNSYLLPSNYETGTEYPYLVNDGGKYYIVKVEEATKSAKLNKEYEDDYYGDEKADFISRKIAYDLSTSDTWKKAANTYYVKQMAVIFHDDYVLDYFEATFPEIYDN